MHAPLYERDFHAWAKEQAALLRAGRLEQADIANIAEEIESMGKSERQQLVNRLIVLLQHLLQWEYQPERRGNSWRRTIRVQRMRLTDHLGENPGLEAMTGEAIATAWRYARIEAAEETRLAEEGFPSLCPWTFVQIMEEGFWPGPQEQVSDRHEAGFHRLSGD